MKYIDFSLPTPAENLACDEALLEAAETGAGNELLRFWESRELFVVVGYANQVAREVNADACRAAKIPILRRCSGGGTVLQGPGCLNYSLVLRIAETGPLSSISQTNRFIMERQQAALQPLLKSPVQIEGCTDLVLDNQKFSGNAQRRRQNYLIFHGTFLLNFDVALIEKFLKMPSKQPGYRRSRPHASFLTNLLIPAENIKSTLRKIWDADTPLPSTPPLNLPELVQKYSSDAWNLKF